MHEIGIDRLRAIASSGGASWAVACEVSQCRARIVGFAGRDAALRGGMAHLVWHLNGQPTCEDCGAWLSHKTSKRCRKGTCEAGR
jgi:hypothetical protein